MPTVNISFAQIATMALSFLDTASVKGDDNSQAMLTAVKSGLRGIASGQYVVSAAPAEPAAPATKRGKAATPDPLASHPAAKK
jgi:hypothetical protein